MEIIIYTNRCMSCAYKQQWSNIKQFAREHKLQVKQRNTRSSKQWRELAEQYEIELPFAVMNGNAISLNEPLERLL